MYKIFPVEVYYEDTDFSGAVYHANYLKFSERARSKIIALLGIDQLALWKCNKIFVVRNLEAKYFKPAYFGDRLEIETHLIKVCGASIELLQKVFKDQECIVQVDVKLALVSDGRPIRLPKDIRKKLLYFISL